MKKHTLSTLLAALVLIVWIVFYNYWALSHGRCHVSSFFALSPPAMVLLFFIFVAFLLLCGIRSRKQQYLTSQYCGCGSLLDRSWQFCPNCGSSSKPT